MSFLEPFVNLRGWMSPLHGGHVLSDQPDFPQDHNVFCRWSDTVPPWCAPRPPLAPLTSPVAAAQPAGTVAAAPPAGAGVGGRQLGKPIQPAKDRGRCLRRRARHLSQQPSSPSVPLPLRATRQSPPYPEACRHLRYLRVVPWANTLIHSTSLPGASGRQWQNRALLANPRWRHVFDVGPPTVALPCCPLRGTGMAAG